MQISLYWLNELLDLRGYSTDFFIEKLTVSGFEVEDCLLVKGYNTYSIVLDIYPTANRGDVFSIRGIAKEVRIIIKRRANVNYYPPVLKVQKVRQYFYLQRRFRAPFPFLGGSQVFETIPIQYNTFKLNYQKGIKYIRKFTLDKFKWRLENTIFRSRKWKPNRLRYKEAVFNSENPKLFSRFVSWSVDNLENFNSPKWLQKKLLYSGITPENNLRDFQNYIWLESGYPFEFYDLNKIRSKCKEELFQLALSPGENTKFIGTNNLEYTLGDDILVLKADQNILSIAGIISNKEFDYTNETKSLLIEGSIYNSKMIRRQSRLLGLKTKRSTYYGKGGMDGTFLIETWYRLFLLLKVLNPKAKFQNRSTAYGAANASQLYHIKYVNSYHFDEVIRYYDLWFREKKLAQIIGSGYYYNRITNKTFEKTNKMISIHIEDFLQRLKIRYIFATRPGQDDEEYWPIIYGRIPQPPSKRGRKWLPPRKGVKEDRYWALAIPNHRREDVVREIDVIEEICRLYGVDQIESEYPIIGPSGFPDFSYRLRKIIRLSLLNQGLNELISYSLTNNKIDNKNKIQLINPLAAEYSALRTSLLPNLAEIVSENIKQGNNIFEGFEFGHIFSQNSMGQYSETEFLSGIFGGNKVKSSWSEKFDELSWFEAKGKMEQILEKFDLDFIWDKFNTNSNINITTLHPYRTAMIYFSDGELLGVFGEMNPLTAKKMSISSTFYLFEFNFKLLTKKVKENNTVLYKDYSSYPRIIKDLSFVINKEISFRSIKDTIYLEATEFLFDVNLLDKYEGDMISSDKVSLCIQLVFQSRVKTLKTENVELILDNISLVLKKKYNAIFRV